MFGSSVPPEGIDLISKLLQYAPSKRISPLKACAHPFFDELRNPDTRLPNGRPLPVLFDWSPQELQHVSQSTLKKLVPPHTREEYNRRVSGEECLFFVLIAYSANDSNRSVSNGLQRLVSV